MLITGTLYRMHCNEMSLSMSISQHIFKCYIPNDLFKRRQKLENGNVFYNVVTVKIIKIIIILQFLYHYHSILKCKLFYMQDSSFHLE